MATKRARDRDEEAMPSTRPGHRQAAASRKPSEAPTLPPPPPKNSFMRPKKRATSTRAPSAKVDEVVADMKNDPRREED